MLWLSVDCVCVCVWGGGVVSYSVNALAFILRGAEGKGRFKVGPFSPRKQNSFTNTMYTTSAKIKT